MVDRQRDKEEPSQRSPQHMKYLDSKLKWFNEATTAYMQRAMVNLKFAKFQSTQKAMYKIAKEIVGFNDIHHSRQHLPQHKTNVVLIGNCATPSNSCVKGHLRSPGVKPIVRYLKQLPNTFVDPNIDEFRTTKNCSRCYNDLHDVESSRQRLKLCNNCQPADDSVLANEVSTYRKKREIEDLMAPIKQRHPKPKQLQRAKRIYMQREKRWTEDDKLRIAERRKNLSIKYTPTTKATKYKLWWNRDSNAARNIMYLGLCSYNNSLPITFTKHAAFER